MQNNNILFNNIIQAFKINFKPAIFLQILAISVGISYFYWDSAKPVFSFFSELKTLYGPVYSIISTALFGGLIPCLYLLLTGKIKTKPIQTILFYCALWALMGWIVDSFYNFQTVLFGEGNNVLTIIKKTIFDQFVFSTFLTCPFLTVCYLWKDQGFNWSNTRQHLDASLFKIKIPTTVITNWLIWIPSVSVIYALPSALQIPMFNLVLCFFVLMLSFLNTDATA